MIWAREVTLPDSDVSDGDENRASNLIAYKDGTLERSRLPSKGVHASNMLQCPYVMT